MSVSLGWSPESAALVSQARSSCRSKAVGRDPVTYRLIHMPLTFAHADWPCGCCGCNYTVVFFKWLQSPCWLCLGHHLHPSLQFSMYDVLWPTFFFCYPTHGQQLSFGKSKRTIWITYGQFECCEASSSSPSRRCSQHSSTYV